MFRSVYSAAVYGVDSRLIRVEVDVSDGLPGFDMVGFLSTHVKEAQNRVRTALKNSGFLLPPKRITVNLSPADLKKTGTGFDLPIAVAILSAYGEIRQEKLDQTMIVGELSLNGNICEVHGVLAMSADAKEEGFVQCIVPAVNQNEAKLISGIKVVPVTSLRELVEYLNGTIDLKEEEDQENDKIEKETYDFRDICGQETVKRAAMTAAAGFHHMMMIGPPGSGKSMIAKRMPGIMPDMTREEEIEVSRIYSVLGMLPNQKKLMNQRPFRAPHHTVTQIGLTGGGNIPKPGEISLAHRGILFLDELPEFKRESIEVLRQPVETKKIQIFRNGYEYNFPGNFMLVAAMNPCPCGYFPDMSRCNCTQTEIRKYMGKISYPLLDRIDLTVEVPQVKYEEINGNPDIRIDTKSMKEKVIQARMLQKERFAGTDKEFNSQIEGSEMERYCNLKEKDQKLLELAYQEMKLSVRGIHKILRVSRTIADLEGEEQIRTEHLAEAFSYRTGCSSFILH